MAPTTASSTVILTKPEDWEPWIRPMSAMKSGHASIQTSLRLQKAFWRDPIDQSTKTSMPMPPHTHSSQQQTILRSRHEVLLQARGSHPIGALLHFSQCVNPKKAAAGLKPHDTRMAGQIERRHRAHKELHEKESTAAIHRISEGTQTDKEMKIFLSWHLQRPMRLNQMMNPSRTSTKMMIAH